jgi:tetratricopeptide (TPR) repeat protein
MRSRAGPFLIAAAGALLFWALFFGGGVSDSRLFWIGIVAEAIGFGAVAAGLAGWLPLAVPRRAGLISLVLLAASVGWLGVTMVWSIAPDLSWVYLNRGLVYLAFALLGVMVAATVRMPARLVAGGLAVLVFGVVGWALLGKAIPALFPDGGRIARLRNPIGYWNALALVCAIALPLGLWVATRPNWRRGVRIAGVLLVYLAVIALVLTASRAGILVAAIGVVLWLWLVPAVRLESFGALVVSVVPAAAVGGWATTRAGLVDDGQPLSARRKDGGWFALVVLLVAVAVVFAALWADRADRRFTDEGARRLWTRRIALGVGVLVVAGVVAVSAASGGPNAWLREFRGGGEVANSGRLGSFSSNNRWEWWKEAWQVFESKPAGGKGANTFAIARLRVRKGSSVTNAGPHNIALQALSETGIVGFLLTLAAVVAALAAIYGTLRRLRGSEHAAAAALAVAVPVYVLHSLVDIDWDFVAVSAPVFFVGGLLIGLGGEVREARGSERPLLAAAAAVCLLGAVYSLTAPWLASNRTNDAISALADVRPAAAASAARDASNLNPFAVEPLYLLSTAYALAGDERNAVRELERATRNQPENPDTWLQLGEYQLQVCNVFPAYRALNNAYTLDPFGPTGVPGGPLDKARAYVEKRATCRR